MFRDTKKTYFYACMIMFCLLFAVAGGCVGDKGKETPAVTEPNFVPTPVDNTDDSDTEDSVSDNEQDDQEIDAVIKHADGTLVKREGGDRVYLIDDGKRRLLRINVDTFKSRHYDTEDVIAITAAEMESYPRGSDITAANYKNPDRRDRYADYYDEDYRCDCDCDECRDGDCYDCECYDCHDCDDCCDENHSHDDSDDSDSSTDKTVEVYDVEKVGPGEVAHNLLNAPEGVSADDHYMRGKLEYPFSVIYPERGFLQVTIDDVKDNGDGTYTISGNIPAFDDSKIEAMYMTAAVVGTNGKFSESSSMRYVATDDTVRMRVGRGDMTGSPQMVAFGVSFLAKEDTGQVFIAKLVESAELASDFIDAAEGAMAYDNVMQGRISYPFTVAYPEKDLLEVEFRGVIDADEDTFRVFGSVPTLDRSKIETVHITAAVVDWNGVISDSGSVSVGREGDDFKIDLSEAEADGLAQEIAFKIVYDSAD